MVVIIGIIANIIVGFCYLVIDRWLKAVVNVVVGCADALLRTLSPSRVSHVQCDYKRCHFVLSC